MKLARSLIIASLAFPALPAAAASEDGDRVLGHMLTLVQSVVRIAAHSETPQESLRAFDEVLAGRNADVALEHPRPGRIRHGLHQRRAARLEQGCALALDALSAQRAALTLGRNAPIMCP